MNIGYHDDSFCYREGSPLKGVTLPESLGGADYAQLQLGLDVGAENKWVTDSMGGEVRPEIQSSAFTSWPGGSGQVDAMQACIELEHTAWKLDQTSQSYSATDPDVAAAVREMGYDLSADTRTTPTPPAAVPCSASRSATPASRRSTTRGRSPSACRTPPATP